MLPLIQSGTGWMEKCRDLQPLCLELLLGAATKAQTEPRRGGRVGKGAEEALFLLCVSKGWRIMARREMAVALFLLCKDKDVLLKTLGHVWESNFL